MYRIDSLDWQRGLLAFSIMLYHLIGWQLDDPDSSSLLGRLGIYGVSMFFVLSGLSMAYVYSKYVRDLSSSVSFLIRRIFRIWPVLWLAVGYVTAVKIVTGKDPEWLLAFLNITTVFGFVSPDAYINTGAWSIGNEMVYYSLTPFIIMLYNKNVHYGNFLTALTVIVGIIFSFFLMSDEKTLTEQWSLYVNPFNNLFFYCLGVAIFYNCSSVSMGKKTTSLCLLAGVAIFILLPSEGDKIHLVTGVGRVAFSVASVLLVIAFYKNSFSIPDVIAVPLTKLGVVTYSVYLLHPLIYQTLIFVLKNTGFTFGASIIITLSVISTIVISLLVYKVIEEPFIRLGRQLTAVKI